MRMNLITLPIRNSLTCSSEQAELYKEVQVFGPASLQRGIRAIDEEFKDNYAEHVQKDPARVPPMALEVDAEILNGNRRGRSRPRPQGEDKARALRLMVAELLKLGVIRASTERNHRGTGPLGCQEGLGEASFLH